MDDIAPKLLGKIQKDFQTMFDKSEIISKLYAKVRDGTATYKEANDFAFKVGDCLARVYKNNLSSAVLPDGKMYYNIANRIINPTMKNNYDLITEVTEQVQQSLNESAGIGIKSIVPELNQDRIDGLVNKTANAENYDDVAKIMEEAIINFSQSIVTDFIRKNAEFQANAGLQPVIMRKLAGGCCEWCRTLAGTYKYPYDVPKDLYRRHSYCRCTVEYYPKDGRGIQNSHSKQWRSEEEYDKIQSRKTIGLQTFRSIRDPLVDVMGTAVDTHPEEVRQMIQILEEWGVEINKSNALGYGVARRGTRGVMSITDNASYGAWVHEFQHVKDAKENGWDAAEVLYDNPEERIRRERKAYQLEIDLANSLGYTKVAKELERLLDEEIKNIRVFFGI